MEETNNSVLLERWKTTREAMEFHGVHFELESISDQLLAVQTALGSELIFDTTLIKSMAALVGGIMSHVDDLRHGRLQQDLLPQ